MFKGRIVKTFSGRIIFHNQKLVFHPINSFTWRESVAIPVFPCLPTGSCPRQTRFQLEKAGKVGLFCASRHQPALRSGRCPAFPVFAESFDEVLQQSHVAAEGVDGLGRTSVPSKRRKNFLDGALAVGSKCPADRHRIRSLSARYRKAGTRASQGLSRTTQHNATEALLLSIPAAYWRRSVEPGF